MSPHCSFKPVGEQGCSPGAAFCTCQLCLRSIKHCWVLPAPRLPCLLLSASSCWCLWETKDNTEQSHPCAKGGLAWVAQGKANLLPGTAFFPSSAQ